MVVPLLVGFTISHILAEPFYEIAQRYNPAVFAVSPKEKAEGAREARPPLIIPLENPGRRSAPCRCLMLCWLLRGGASPGM